MKTYVTKVESIQRNWYVVDATDKVLGRVASEVASILRGKNKPIFSPNIDAGDFVIIVNAEKIKVTGKKQSQKMYRHHTGYAGGLKEITFEKLIEKRPERVLELAIKGMLPHNRLGRQMYRKLKVYAGPEHNHEAQQPKELEF